MTTGGWAPAPEPWISYVADSDGDGLDDYQERVLFGSDPSRADTDGDGLNDADEADRHQDPTDSDSDDDGVPDGQDSWSAPKDRDGDGLTGEVSAGLSEIDPDSDDDGLNDGDEWLSTHFPTEEGATSSPTDPDSDDDGFLDGAERDNGTDPSTPDFPGDLRTEIPDDIGPFVDTPDPGALPLPEPDDPALLFGAGSTPPNGSAAEATAGSDGSADGGADGGANGSGAAAEVELDVLADDVGAGSHYAAPTEPVDEPDAPASSEDAEDVEVELATSRLDAGDYAAG